MPLAVPLAVTVSLRPSGSHTLKATRSVTVCAVCACQCLLGSSTLLLSSRTSSHCQWHSAHWKHVQVTTLRVRAAKFKLPAGPGPLRLAAASLPLPVARAVTRSLSGHGSLETAGQTACQCPPGQWPGPASLSLRGHCNLSYYGSMWVHYENGASVLCEPASASLSELSAHWQAST